jgi:hypothetical protein
MPQIAPPKVLNSGFKKRVIKPMWTIFKRFSRLGRPKHTPSSVALRARNPEGGHSNII